MSLHYIETISAFEHSRQKWLLTCPEVESSTYLLGVPAIRHRLVVIVFQDNMTELAIWDILNNMPRYRESAIPLVLLPVVDTFWKINTTCHLCHSTKLSTRIHLKNVESLSEPFFIFKTQPTKSECAKENSLPYKLHKTWKMIWPDTRYRGIPRPYRKEQKDWVAFGIPITFRQSLLICSI